MNAKQLQQQEVINPKQESINFLREQINPNEGIVIIVRHVSTSGMSRVMDVYTRDLNSRLSYHVALACGLQYNRKHEGVTVKGCGMDMIYWLNSNITSTIYTNKTGDLPYKAL